MSQDISYTSFQLEFLCYMLIDKKSSIYAVLILKQQVYFKLVLQINT